MVGLHSYFAPKAMALGWSAMSILRVPEVDVLAPDECPIVNVWLRSLTADLLWLCGARALLPNLGRRGRLCIVKNCAIETVSRRLACAYKDLEME